MVPLVFRRSASPLFVIAGSALLGAVLLLAPAPARAVDPWLDTGFDRTTPLPDAERQIE